MTINELQIKLSDSLKDYGWYPLLKSFILSDDFQQIIKTLYNQSQANEHFTPVIKDLFNMFKECKYSDLKVIIIDTEPNATVNASTGLAWSTRINTPQTYTLFNTLDPKITPINNLKHWANQGVLLLNSSLTTTINKKHAHLELWKPFTGYLLEMLNTYNSGLIYVFVGEHTKQYHSLISTNNYKFFIPELPDKIRDWNCKFVFDNINKLLFKQYGETISWT